MKNLYTIKKVENLPELKDAFANGFIDLFDECFNGAPYFLKYSDEELFKIYADHFKTGFVLFSYLDGKMVGFAGSRPLLEDEYIVDDVKTKFPNPEEYFYHSDLGVSKTQRGKGTAQMLIKETIRLSPTRYVLMRTKDDNRASIDLHLKMGFTHTGISQKGNGSAENDTRIYLVYDKEAKNNV